VVGIPNAGAGHPNKHNTKLNTTLVGGGGRKDEGEEKQKVFTRMKTYMHIRCRITLRNTDGGKS